MRRNYSPSVAPCGNSCSEGGPLQALAPRSARELHTPPIALRSAPARTKTVVWFVPAADVRPCRGQAHSSPTTDLRPGRTRRRARAARDHHPNGRGQSHEVSEINRPGHAGCGGPSRVSACRRPKQPGQPIFSPPYDVEVFVRGSFNEWALGHEMKFDAVENEYVAYVELTPGGYEFKIASEDWSTVDLGVADDGIVQLGVPEPITAAHLQQPLPRGDRAWRLTHSASTSRTSTTSPCWSSTRGMGGDGAERLHLPLPWRAVFLRLPRRSQPGDRRHHRRGHAARAT